MASLVRDVCMLSMHVHVCGLPLSIFAYDHRYYCTDLLIDAFNMAACLAVIRKIHRKRRLSRGSGGSVHTASGGMPQLIEDLVLLLASYNLLYNIVFGVGVDVAYLLPPDSPLGARATDLVRRYYSARR